MSEFKIRYTKGEEIFNMVSHISGVAVGIVALVLCVVFSAISGNSYDVVASAIYGASMIILYSVSSVYHGLNPHVKGKEIMRTIDHCMIFVLIAGTYTPVCLCALREYNTALGWSLFGIVWGIAALGITLNAISVKKFKIFSAVCYIAMGWCIVAVWKPTVQMLGTGGITLMLLGGVSYTIGAAFYYFFKKKKYMHSVFHLFVVFGSILQMFSVLFYIVG